MDKSMIPVNTEETRISFNSEKELLEYIKEHNIQDHQEFWFSVKTDTVYHDCAFSYFYEG